MCGCHFTRLERKSTSISRTLEGGRTSPRKWSPGRRPVGLTIQRLPACLSLPAGSRSDCGGLPLGSRRLRLLSRLQEQAKVPRCLSHYREDASNVLLREIVVIRIENCRPNRSALRPCLMTRLRALKRPAMRFQKPLEVGAAGLHLAMAGLQRLRDRDVEQK